MKLNKKICSILSLGILAGSLSYTNTYANESLYEYTMNESGEMVLTSVDGSDASTYATQTVSRSFKIGNKSGYVKTLLGSGYAANQNRLTVSISCKRGSKQYIGKILKTAELKRDVQQQTNFSMTSNQSGINFGNIQSGDKLYIRIVNPITNAILYGKEWSSHN